MKYYVLTTNATMLLRVSGRNSAEFIFKRGYEEEVNERKLELAARVAQFPEIDMYAPTMIKRRFPDAIETDSAKFEDAVKKVEQFNEEYDDNAAEIAAMSLEDLKTYITSAPARMPKLINYTQLNQLWQVLYATSDSGFMSVDEGERSDEEVMEDIHALYSLLKDAEITNDNSTIQQVLTLAENVSAENIGVTFEQIEQEGQADG
jgi:hypothetical protein